MPKYSSSQEWLEQSALLLKAYPTTTKITTKYNLPNPSKASTRKRKAPSGEETTTAQAPAATLEVRTYNPDAGVILKYQTNKGWEVGRLLASLGRLGRNMAALPEIEEGGVLLDVKEEVASGTGTPLPEVTGAEKSRPTVPVPVQAAGGGGAGGGGGKKKKKGKR